MFENTWFVSICSSLIATLISIFVSKLTKHFLGDKIVEENPIYSIYCLFLGALCFITISVSTIIIWLIEKDISNSFYIFKIGFSGILFIIVALIMVTSFVITTNLIKYMQKGTYDSFDRTQNAILKVYAKGLNAIKKQQKVVEQEKVIEHENI
ncbi:hypothetical protein EHE19_002825 [Ruminiclostridium herbifermentans]|uniref:Uncharacterized protein n=1 Tax=Ruminiclostridium herbifermentans TaxID=2488810 RepID=A0A4U7JHQ9_9FIRM|nr:hypothetical protein [Ruminiclostridium herbifermentans]QNU67476.1 hypothetical protein EHE19_002825 [Ruminiclostridium herbifermentans]